MSDTVDKAVFLSEGSGLSLCEGEQSIEFHGQTFTPDSTKGYLRATMSHGFPVVTVYGQALHPSTIANSWRSLIHQSANYEHVVKAYSEDNATDRFLGAVVAAHFPDAPAGGWKVGTDTESAPGIEFVSSFAKLARGMDKVIGQHQSGRHRYAVSMEVSYRYADCAFAVALNGKKPKNETPDDMVAAGWELIPWEKSDDALLATYSIKKKRIVGDYKGRRVVQMMGGIGGQVHFAGFGLVHYGAEKEARILQLAASSTDDVVESALGPLKLFVERVSKK
jgi:hypothetical protein